KWLLLLLLISTSYLQSQNFIHGHVIDEHKNDLEGVSVYYKNTTHGVTTNKNGAFQIKYQSGGILVFQYLGYKSQEFLVNDKENWEIRLTPEIVHLNQVELNDVENPAYEIIKKAIAKREENKNKVNAYSASFYSRGLIEVKVDSSN